MGGGSFRPIKSNMKYSGVRTSVPQIAAIQNTIFANLMSAPRMVRKFYRRSQPRNQFAAFRYNRNHDRPIDHRWPRVPFPPDCGHGEIQIISGDHTSPRSQWRGDGNGGRAPGESRPQQGIAARLHRRQEIFSVAEYGG